MTTRAQKDARRDRLFDYLASHPEGVTITQIQYALGLQHQRVASKAVRELRLLLGEMDEINLVCDPQKMREPWLYRLVGNLEAARGWQVNQIRHMESRLETSLAIANSLVSANPDGRTTEAKKAKRVSVVLTRLMEDLEELNHA